MEKFSPTPERIGKQPELIHTGDYDIVLSPDFKIDAKELEAFLDTIDEALVIDETKLAEEYDDGSDATEEIGKRYILETKGQKYFVKQKWYDVRQQEKLHRYRNIEQDKTYGSILNEFLLTPEVERVLSSAGLKEKIATLGYEDVRLIPVRAAVVRRKTGQKFLVYDFHEIREFHDDSLEGLLSEGLLSSGIEPRDLEYNLCRDAENEKIIYLLDIEGYRRVQE